MLRFFDYIRSYYSIYVCIEWWLMLVDQVFLAIYIVELSLKMYVWRLKFFKQFWNNFGTYNLPL